MKLKINWDALGIATSTACAIHCALLPLLVTSLPVFGINIVHNLVFEWSMIGIAFFVGAYSLYHGYKKHHGSFTPMIIFLIGFIFLVLKQFFDEYEYLFLGIAVVFIIFAHYSNYRFCQRSKCSSPHHSH
jgi:hypothetical protein